MLLLRLIIQNLIIIILSILLAACIVGSFDSVLNLSMFCYLSDGYSYAVDGYYDDRYIFAVNNSTPTYGLYKMREQEYDTDDNNDPGVTISFISLDIGKLNDVLNDKKANTEDLYNELDKVVRVPDATYSDVIQEYFADVESEGAYLIAEAYVNKIANLSSNTNCYFGCNKFKFI